MTHAVETMAYANDVPWHGLGKSVSDDLTPAQMAKVAGINWKVEKLPMLLESGKKVPDKFALVRTKDEKVLSVVGSTYKPVQNVDALDFFKKFIKAGDMKMETAGSLWNGRYIWGLARIGKDFKLGKKDEIRGYCLISQPHVHGKAMTIQFTPIRVVCWNTLTFALGSNLSGGVGAFRMPHSQQFDDATKLAAEQALGLASNDMKSFQEAASLLVKKKVKPNEAEEYFCEVLEFDPNKKKRTPKHLPQFKDALEKAPGQDMVTAKGTMWGAVNAVTYVIDHNLSKNRETALKNIWHGHLADIKRRALNVALKRAA